MNWKKCLNSSLIIAGTTIGAGMLGIPLVSYEAGFYPALVTLLVGWAFMLATGFLFLEVSLNMPLSSNILSMAERCLGKRGKWVSGIMFLFLYMCLMVAYFAEGAPLLAGLMQLESGPWSYVLFGSIFWLIVTKGVQWIGRVNALLMVGLVLTYFGLMGSADQLVSKENLAIANWGAWLAPLPVLFSAFGYHNVIPPLATYCEKERKTLSWALIIGTMIPLLVFIFWQWLVLGAIPPEMLAGKGRETASLLAGIAGDNKIKLLARSFAFFAVITSLLGVAFSMVDFMRDGLGERPLAKRRGLLSLFTFAPACLFAIAYPMIFKEALGVAGGIGEAFLNGLLPVMLVWSLRRQLKHKGRALLIILGALSLFVMVLEIRHLLGH